MSEHGWREEHQEDELNARVCDCVKDTDRQRGRNSSGINCAHVFSSVQNEDREEGKSVSGEHGKMERAQLGQ